MEGDCLCQTPGCIRPFAHEGDCVDGNLDTLPTPSRACSASEASWPGPSLLAAELVTEQSMEHVKVSSDRSIGLAALPLVGQTTLLRTPTPRACPLPFCSTNRLRRYSRHSKIVVCLLTSVVVLSFSKAAQVWAAAAAVVGCFVGATGLRTGIITTLFGILACFFSRANVQCCLDCLAGLLAVPQQAGREFSGEDFKLIKTLGRGGFGSVCLAIHVPSGKSYALKTHEKTRLEEMNHMKNIAREREIHCMLDHPFVVPMFGGFEDKCSLSFVLEPSLGGDLLACISAAGRLDIGTARTYAAQVSLAIEYIHERGVVYRDVKPENCILGLDGYLKVTDFGWAKHLGKSGSTRTLCGTPAYTAPEIILLQKYGKAVDWWSLGVLIFEMLTGQAPFQGKEPLDIYEQTLHGKPAFERIAAHPSIQSRYAIMVVKQLLSRDPAMRVGAQSSEVSGIRDAKWFEGFPWEALLQKDAGPIY